MRISPNELRRSGVTLIEVLVSIFVASIGLLALLALFPVGALSMRQALKDSRCAQSSVNAMALFKTQKIGQDPAIASFFGTPDPYVDAFPIPGFPATAILGNRPAASPNGPSYPIYIDPLGASIKTLNALGTNNHLPIYPETLLPSGNYPRILRAGVSFVQPGAPGIPLYEKWFSLLDDIDFDQAYPGQPGTPGGAFVRDPRYTFAYMVRRPYAGNPSTYDVTVVVYAGRAINTTMGSFEETACNQVIFNKGSTTVIVPFGTAGVQPQRPTVKPGSWLLDATIDGVGIPQAYFYRVVDVIDNGNSTLTLELQTPARQTTNQGNVIFLDNVAEVFEKGTISIQ